MPEITEQFLLENLPTGSGFNSGWGIKDEGNKFIATTSFQVIGEHDMYEGFASITVRVLKSKPKEFKLFFDDSRSRELNRKHELRDFLIDTIFYTLFPKA